MKIDILGTSYKITHDLLRDDRDGECNTVSKTIRIKPTEQLGGENDAERLHLRDMVTRHEMVHAFLDESGLGSYSADETLVDWIAAQMPKMVDAMRAAGAL